MDKYELLKQKIDEAKTKSLLASDMKVFIKIVLEASQKSKSELEKLTLGQIGTLKQAVAYLEKEHTKLKNDLQTTVSRETSKVQSETKDMLKKALKALSEIKKVKAIDGKDADEDVIVGKVLAQIKLPEQKETALDTGEGIANKLESLKDDARLDFSAIKNVPEATQGRPNGGGWRNLAQLHDVTIDTPTNAQVLKYNSTTGQWENGTGGGGSGDALVANPLSQFAATTSLQLKNTISDETGSGALVFATSPTLITPLLGTPTSGVMTNVTGTASGLTAGTVTTNANLTGVVTSIGNATAIANSAISNAMLANGAVANLTGTNSGDNATNTQYSGLVSNATHTGEVTGSTALTIANNAVVEARIANNAVTNAKIAGSGTRDATTFYRGDGTFSAPVGSGRVVALTDAASIVVDATLGDVFTVTLGGNRTLANPTGAINGQKMVFRIRQDATGSRTLAYDTKFRFNTDIPSITLTTTLSKTDYIGVMYHSADDKFDVIALTKGC